MTVVFLPSSAHTLLFLFRCGVFHPPPPNSTSLFLCLLLLQTQPVIRRRGRGGLHMLCLVGHPLSAATASASVIAGGGVGGGGEGLGGVVSAKQSASPLCARSDNDRREPHTQTHTVTLAATALLPKCPCTSAVVCTSVAPVHSGQSCHMRSQKAAQR